MAIINAKTIFSTLDMNKLFIFEEQNYEIEFSFINQFYKNHTIPLEKCERILTEYLRFISLKTLFEDCVPSTEIDLMWHHHLTHTKSYHRMNTILSTLVGKTIFIHHNPSINMACYEKHKTNYTETLELYKREFGELVNIWDIMEDRFSKTITIGIHNKVKELSDKVLVDKDKKLCYWSCG